MGEPSHTTPGTTTAPMNGADILVECLIRHGVEVVFAYPGGARMPIHQALTQVAKTGSAPSCRGTSRAAASWPRATPAPPARSASASPPAAPARPTSSPASPTPRWTRSRSSPSPARSARTVIGTDAFQETPIVEVCRAITKHHYLVTRTEDIARVMKEAFHIATHRPARARSSSTCPRTCRSRTIVPDCDPPMNLPGYRPLPQGDARPNSKPVHRGDPREQEADHLRRRRHHRRRRRGRAARRSPSRPASPSASTRARPRQLPGRPLPVPANARHARHRLLQLRGQRRRPAAGPRRPLRRPRDRQGQRVRQARQDRPHRHRPVRDQQEQVRPRPDPRRREARARRT